MYAGCEGAIEQASVPERLWNRGSGADFPICDAAGLLALVLLECEGERGMFRTGTQWAAGLSGRTQLALVYAMNLQIVGPPWALGKMSVLVLFVTSIAAAQQPPSPHREFRPGALTRIEDIPAGRFRTRIDRLPVAARQRALEWLRGFHFTELDLQSLEADAEGGIYYVDAFSVDQAAAATEPEPVVAEAAVPVDPFPASLAFHSKPGAPNVLFLNFCGEDVSGTAWNTSLGRTVIPALAFSTDSDRSTFSDAEQVAIKRIWERVAEDYAPFNIDVTTERPPTFGTRVAHALITRNTDANGDPNPSSSAGGVAYVNVFGKSSYANYRPAWIYHNNLGNNEANIAEATSHEIGHNLGLSHDGKTDGTEYYSGHGSGDISWGPIMGTGYNRNVSQWSKGEYYLANNTQDDLATIAAKIPYLTDDHGGTPASATPLVFTGGTNIASTTPETDPANASPANKGVLERNTDMDVFSFQTGSGPVNLTVNPWIMPSGTRGGNLDVLLELRDETGATVLTNNPASQTTAQIQATLSEGTYYLYVRNTGTGNPTNSTPTGYTSYGSIGQYFISGYVTAFSQSPPTVQLIVTANNPAWGTVSPTNGTYPAGSVVEVLATPTAYCQFVIWTNDATGTTNPITLVLETNALLEAMFAEILTTNHPTPYWWLASYGYTNNFETAVTNIGANGFRLWQSYIAGLNPNDPDDQFRLSVNPGANGTGDALRWNTVTNRVYTLWWSTNLSSGFTPVPGASNLPWTVNGYTNRAAPSSHAVLYRVEVRKP